MDESIAKRIAEELYNFSSKKYALTNEYGEVLYKGACFIMEHDPLDIKSPKSLVINNNKKKVGYLYIDEDIKIVREIGKALKSMAESILKQEYYTNILTADEKRIDQLLYEYLKTETFAKKELYQTLESFGINLAKHRQALVIEIMDDGYLSNYDTIAKLNQREQKIAKVKREIAFLLNSFYTHHKENIIGYMGGNYFVILKDLGENPDEYMTDFEKTVNSLFQNIKETLRTEITVGVGDYKNTKDGVIESYEEALTAINFGKQNWGGGKVFHFDSFGVVAPLFSGVNVHNIAHSESIVKKLTDVPDLKKTLEIYFKKNISLLETAKELKIHRNTLIYRLDKISQLTGFDPRKFNDAFQLKVALVLDKFGARND
jgi:carbohydrate diacid regulator